MKTIWVACAKLALLSIALSSCSPDENPVLPAGHAITGHVKLTGCLVADDGSPAGTRVVGDADGVRVLLMRGQTVAGETLTENGAYRFTGIAPGGYVLASRVADGIEDVTETVVIAGRDVAVADTIRLESRGDLRPIPNPIGTLTSVYFEVSEAAHLDLQILDLSGNLVRTLVSRDAVPGPNVAFWNGMTANGTPAPGEMFWVVYKAGLDERGQLLFR